jgi:uncharacterized protein HemX
VRSWFKSYGFATLVLAALACALWIAANVAAPTPVPDFALQAEEIYRLEVGAAFFVAFYLVAMAFVLALSGRGFAEFGARGLKTETVVERAANDNQQAALARQREADRQMQKQVKELRLTIQGLDERLESHEQQLEGLKEGL